ncbi:MAG: zinc-ribbon domain-containing protein [Ruminococcus sp.]
MNNNISNPYQHNVDIIKGFFRKPIILALAILMAVSCICTMFSGMFAVSVEAFNGPILKNSSFDYSTMVTSSSGNINLPTASILVTVSFFFFYFFSKSQSKSLKVPAKIFKIVSLIELIIVYVLFISFIVAIAVVLAYGFEAVDKGFSTLFSSAFNYDGLSAQVRHEIFTVACSTALITLFIVGAVFVWIYTMRYRFAKSIDDSMRGINLYKNGAMTYGVISIVTGALSVMAVPALYTVFTPMYATVLLIPTLIGSAVTIIMGIVAIKYASYIKNISMNFTTEPAYAPEETDDFEEAMPFGNIQGVTSHIDDSNPYAQTQQKNTDSYCNKCGNSVSAEDLFCNKCGYKLK